MAKDVYDLYSEAAAISEKAAREAYIKTHCSHDEKLAERLRAMLTVREDAEGLFERAVAPARPASDAAEAASLGRVGRFRLDRLIGRGGMGNVFLAYDEQLERSVALKFPRLDALGNPESLERFLREARLAAQLTHANLVEIYDVGIWGPACFIASQWCEGGDLAQWLVEHPGPQEPAWSADLVRSIARAVAYCHGQGVVHLDIKPANIILAADTDSSGDSDSERLRPMLTDFGVARVIEEGLTSSHSSLLLGTPLYMAPEQAECQREKIGPASDIFALGVILHELLYGKRPFEGDSAMEVLDQLRSGDTLVLPASKNVPWELRVICQRCLEHEAADRYPSADALAEDLDRYLRGEPIHARPTSHLQRLWRWFQRPERIVQAGVIMVAIQLLVIGNLTLGTLAKALGWEVPTTAPLNVIFYESILLILTLHAPSAAIGWMTVRQRSWAVYLGAALSVLTLLAMGQVLVTGESPLSHYDNNPLATFLLHLMWMVAISIQMAAYFAALPAARAARRA